MVRLRCPQESDLWICAPIPAGHGMCWLANGMKAGWEGNAGEGPGKERIRGERCVGRAGPVLGCSELPSWLGKPFHRLSSTSVVDLSFWPRTGSCM